MDITREEDNALQGARRLEKMLEGAPFQRPGLAIVGIVVSNTPAAPELDGLHKIDAQHGSGGDNKGNIRMQIGGFSDLGVHSSRGEQARELVGRDIEPLGTCIQSDNLVAWSLVCVVPVKSLRRALKFAFTIERKRHTNKRIDGPGVFIEVAATPGMQSSEEGLTAFIGELLRGITPALEERVG